MLHYLVTSNLDFLERYGLGFLRLFADVHFRAVLALISSFATVLVLGKRVIRWLVRQKVGDNPEFYNKSLNELMKSKANTPTMGGILIAFAIFGVTFLLADVVHNFYVMMGLLCLVWLFGVGLVDDWLKLTSARRKPGSREGLFSAEKLMFQVGLALLLGLFIHHWGINKSTLDFDQMSKMTHSLNLPLLKTWVWDSVSGSYVPSPGLIVLGTWPFVILTVFVITGASNAVNLTDGMDGLASGIMLVVASAFTILCLIAGKEDLAKWLLVPYIPRSDELAILCAAVVGACMGFLWFNCNPAQVFMGDTGSLPLGGLLGFTAVVIRQEFLLLIIGGVFVMEAMSVILQVGYFKASGGKRIFKCAPIHHHFHLSGWTENQVVTRFWLASMILAAVALLTIKLR